MASAGKGYVDIEPDLKNFGRQLNSKLARESKAAGDQFNKGFSSKVSTGLDKVGASGGKLSKVLSGVGPAAVAGAAVAAGAALVHMVQDGLRGLMEAERVGAQTAAVISSTGSAANVTQEQVKKLGDEFQRLTGKESETLQEGANLLLTFTNIRNETGKNNDVFNQATEMLGDMSIALGTDAKSAAIQLGKALNDPIKGVTALTRVGVSFTDQQKETIRSLVETGDVMGAQKIILKELAKEFGNSTEAYAETSAAAAARVRAEWGEFKEGIASEIVPILDALGKGFDKAGGKGESAGKKISSTWAKLIGIGFLSDAIRKSGEESDRAAGKTGKHAAAATAAKGAIEGEVTAVDDLTDSLQEEAKAHVAALSAQVARLSSSLSASQAELSFRDSVDAATEALRDGANTTREDQQALLGAQEAALRVAAAQVQLAEDTAAAAGQQLTAADKARITKEALERLAGTLDPNNPLRAGIQGLIDQLGDIPREVDIDIELHARLRGDAVKAMGEELVNTLDREAAARAASQRATGGPVIAGQSYIVGERGPEQFVPTENGVIVPNHELAMAGASHMQGDVYIDGSKLGRWEENRRRSRA